MKAPANIRNHSNFNADDYAYLIGKGWSNKEIKTRWDEEAARGCAACRWETSTAKSKLRAVTGR